MGILSDIIVWHTPQLYLSGSGNMITASQSLKAGFQNNFLLIPAGQ